MHETESVVPSFLDLKFEYYTNLERDPYSEEVINGLVTLTAAAENAILENDNDAMTWMGFAKYHGSDGQEIDKDAGRQLLQRAAQNNHIDAIRSLAYIYANIELRMEDAARLNIQGSWLGDLECQTWLKLNGHNLASNAADFPITRLLERGLPLPKNVEIFNALQSADDVMQTMIGWNDAKEKYRQIVNFSALEMPYRSEPAFTHTHFTMTGPAGTGKNFFAKLVGKKLSETLYIRHGHVTTIDLADILTRDKRSFLMRFHNEGNHHLDKEHNGNFWINIFEDMTLMAQGGILLIKDSRKSDIVDEYKPDILYEQFILGQILQFISQPNLNFLACFVFEDDLQMKTLFKKQRDLEDYFNIHIKFDNFTVDELQQITLNEIENLSVQIEPDAVEAIHNELTFKRRHALPQRSNMNLVKNLIAQTLLKRTNRNPRFLNNIKAEDVPNSNIIFDKDSVDAALSELNSLIGLDGIKDEIGNITNLLKALKSSNAEKPSLHFVFTGAPGTGKTTVARLLGKILYRLGYLSSGHVVETDGTAMIGKFHGSTPSLVKDKIDQADGGILFIDEAYTLGQNQMDSYQDKFREEAISVLLKHMEDRRGRMVVIAAGYDNEMINFVESNSGLQSRFTRFINFSSYTPDELCKIFEDLCTKSEHALSNAASQKIHAHVSQLKTMAQITSFGNARGIRTLYEKAVANNYQRQFANGVENINAPKTIEANDIILRKAASIKASSKADIDKLLQPITAMIELDDIKKYIEDLVYLSQSQITRTANGLQRIPITLHSIFAGAPGTGKTTVARHLGKILADLGYLSKGHVVEVSKNTMVGQWLGHTPKIVEQKVNLAKGGILFIDEAYTLADSTNGNEYGKEALDTLTKMMEDHRDDLIIIAAGYTKEMEDFRLSNTGLFSRFPFSCTFKSYSHQALVKIFENLCISSGFDVTAEALQKMLSLISRLDTEALDKLGNGRFSRNVFELTVIYQAKRAIRDKLSKDDLYKITPEDITLPKNSEGKKIGFL